MKVLQLITLFVLILSVFSVSLTKKLKSKNKKCHGKKCPCNSNKSPYYTNGPMIMGTAYTNSYPTQSPSYSYGGSSFQSLFGNSGYPSQNYVTFN